MIEAAGVIVEDVDGKVLVLKRKDLVPEGNLLGLPGGKVSTNQRPIDTALQKTEAETGLKFSEGDLEKLNVFSYRVDDSQVTFYAFIVKMQESEPRIDLNMDGPVSYFWIDPKPLVLRNDLMKGMYSIFEFFNKNNLKDR